MSSLGSITTVIEKNIAAITFQHPLSNSFPSELLKTLTLEIQKNSANPEVHCIILQSEGKTFCAGASFDELLSITDLQSGTQFFSGFANVINAMRNCSKIIIGKVHGKAVGGGVGLAAACDYVLAHEEAAIKLSEISIGIGPFVIEPAVSRKIGKVAMSELSLQPQEWKSAQWARDKGLYAQVFDTYDTLNYETEALAQKLASYNPEAITAFKKILWEDTENWDDLLHQRAAISGKLVLSDFTKKALNEFKK